MTEEEDNDHMEDIGVNFEYEADYFADDPSGCLAIALIIMTVIATATTVALITMIAI